MAHGIEAARMGAVARQAQLDRVAQNLANVSTSGYQASRSHFREELIAAEDGVSGVALTERSTDFRPGPVEMTNVSTDFAIQGDGFFGVDRGGRTLLTRRGDFVMDSGGVLRTQQGDPLVDSGGKSIRLDPRGGSWHVGPGGTLVQGGSVVGSFDLRTVDSPSTMEALGGGLFDVGEQAVQGVDAQVVQGALEMSNVQATSEMTEMIRLHRFFESMQSLIQTHTKVDQRVIQLASER